MLESIKREIESERFEKNMHSLILESTNSDDVRDLLLDSVEMDIVGAENDKEMEDLLDTIPEYDEVDAETEAEVESMMESISESII